MKVFLEHGVPYDLASEKGTCENMTTNAETKAVILEIKDGYEL